jgi:hypothetical protein
MKLPPKSGFVSYGMTLSRGLINHKNMWVFSIDIGQYSFHFRVWGERA